MNDLDQVRLSFSTNSLDYLNIILAFIMFGVALNLRVEDFKRVLIDPKAATIGIITQFVLLPLFTFLLVYILQPQPSLALGMIMVAACPGGNMSNFFTYLSKGNTALSVSLTAVGTALAIFMTPINFSFYASLYSPASSLLKEVELDAPGMLLSIFTIAGIPLICGMLLAHFNRKLAEKLSRFFKPGSVIVFLGFVVIAFTNNYQVFLDFIHLVIPAVTLHNTLAIILGFLVAKAGKLGFANQKTLAIETGIQNSGLGLILIFRFFDGMGGMALVAAWYGIWHLISGLTLSLIWSKATDSKSKIPVSVN
jgi:BASS family bile acid:Na+ symporter